MLILTRREGEVIIIDDDIKLHVLGVKGNQVRIGIDAPEDIPVHREEIYKRIQTEKEWISLQNCQLIDYSPCRILTSKVVDYIPFHTQMCEFFPIINNY